MDETKEYPIDRFLAFAREAARRDDRGTLAELRRGLSPSTQEQAWQHVVPYCSRFEDETSRTVWCTIGGLAALLMPRGLEAPADDTYRNLGTTMRELAKGTGEGDIGKALKTFEPKFRRLLSCGDTVSLCEQVVGIGRTAEVKGVRLNLRGLFFDLAGWSDSDKREKTRLRWAKAYFRAETPGADGGETTSDNRAASSAAEQGASA